MKIAVITKKNSYYGLRLLNLLKKENIPVDLAVIVNQSIGEAIRLFASVRRRIGLIETIFESISIIHKNYLTSKIKIWRGFPWVRKYGELCNKVFYCSDPNSRQAAMELMNLQPDLILLGQSGIIKDNVIKIPKIGVLNSHPGILPKYRGIDVVYWALYNNDIKGVGSAIHFVDAGVDTGPIIFTKRHTFSGRKSLIQIQECVYEDCLNLFVRALRNIELIKPIRQNLSEGQQYHKMSRKIKAELNKRLTADNFFMNRAVQS